MNGTTIYNTGKTSEGVRNFFAPRVKTKTSYDEILSQTVEKNSADMTLDEYKNYFEQRLTEIPFDSTRNNDVELIHVSDAAWQKLKDDPAYAEKILSQIAAERSAPNQLQGLYSNGEMKVRYVEASEENCRVVSTEDVQLANLKFDVESFFLNGNKSLIRRLRSLRENFLTQELFKQVGTIQQLRLQNFLDVH